MFKINFEDAPTKELRGGRGLSHRLINPETGCDYLDLHVNVINPGSGVGPYHYHSNADNIYMVLKGRGVVTVEGVEHEVGPGDAMLIPPNERHDVRNIGDEPFHVIEIKAPADSDFIIVEDERP